MNAIIIMMILAVGLILLQIFLSRSSSKWPGLILPVITLCLSFTGVLANVVFLSFESSGTLRLDDENGAVIREETMPETTNAAASASDTSSTILAAVSVFVLLNIPTIILLAVYCVCREKQKRKNALERMQAQDLE